MAHSLDVEYKQRFTELKAKLGRDPNTNDKEYWELTEWHRMSWEQIKERTPKPEPVSDDSGVVIEKAPVIADGDRKCRNCEKPLSKKPGRGRWPVMCTDCKESK